MLSRRSDARRTSDIYISSETAKMKEAVSQQEAYLEQEVGEEIRKNLSTMNKLDIQLEIADREIIELK